MIQKVHLYIITLKISNKTQLQILLFLVIGEGKGCASFVRNVPVNKFLKFSEICKLGKITINRQNRHLSTKIDSKTQKIYKIDIESIEIDQIDIEKNSKNRPTFAKRKNRQNRPN